MNGFALRLVLKKRQKSTRKWPIHVLLIVSTCRQGYPALKLIVTVDYLDLRVLPAPARVKHFMFLLHVAKFYYFNIFMLIFLLALENDLGEVETS